jgi:hypothetical protein
MVGLVETMLKLHGDGSRLTAHGQDEDEMQIAEDLPKAKPARTADGLRFTASVGQHVEKARRWT